MAGLYGNIGNPVQVGGKIGTNDLSASMGAKINLSSTTDLLVMLGGYFGFAFDDPFLLHRGYWQDSKEWVDTGIFKDKLF